MAKRKLKILVVDDHAIVRAGVQQLLAREYDAAITEAANAQQAAEAARKGSFDVIILDIAMPGRSGLSAIAELRAVAPQTPILMLSMHAEEQFAVRALRAGATGYVSKASVSTELIRAIERVINGGRYISEALAQQLACSVVTGDTDADAQSLSAREFEVLRLIAIGKSGKEIADELSLSFKTVSTYRARLLEKLRVKSNAELARFAVRSGIVSEAPAA